MNKKLCVSPLFSGLLLAAGCGGLSNLETDDMDINTRGYTSLRGGNFSLTAAGTEINQGAYEGFWGSAQLAIRQTDSEVEVYVTGLTPNTSYMSHIHNKPCAEGGGAHYLQDKSLADVPENGLWPTVKVDEKGVGQGFASNNFIVTADARSVVIHEPNATKTRIACVDLIATTAYSGAFNRTEAGASLYQAIEGQAWVSGHSSGWSQAEVYATGLLANNQYKAHVHDANCASGGGPHYKQDPTMADVRENGLWPFVNVNELGYGTGWASIGSLVRFEQTNSLVIHELGQSTRIACADLTNHLLAFRSGAVKPTKNGSEGISGRATLSISEDGMTRVSIYASGLAPETAHKVHVHHASCETGGGGHYLQDVAGLDIKSNGLWPSITTDVNGAGKATVTQNFVVRPDARSLVIHNPDDSSIRIACVDLN